MEEEDGVNEYSFHFSFGPLLPWPFMPSFFLKFVLLFVVWRNQAIISLVFLTELRNFVSKIGKKTKRNHLHHQNTTKKSIISFIYHLFFFFFRVCVCVEEKCRFTNDTFLFRQMFCQHLSVMMAVVVVVIMVINRWRKNLRLLKCLWMKEEEKDFRSMQKLLFYSPMNYASRFSDYNAIYITCRVP